MAIEDELQASRDRITKMLSQAATSGPDDVTMAILGATGQHPMNKVPGFGEQLNALRAQRLQSEMGLHQILSSEIRSKREDARLARQERLDEMKFGQHILDKAHDAQEKSSKMFVDFAKIYVGDSIDTKKSGQFMIRFASKVKELTEGGRPPSVTELAEISGQIAQEVGIVTKKGEDVNNAVARIEALIANNNVTAALRAQNIGLQADRLSLERQKFDETIKRNEEKFNFRERELGLRERVADSTQKWRSAQIAKLEADTAIPPAERTRLMRAINESGRAIGEISGLREVLASDMGDRVLGVSGKMRDYLSRTAGQISFKSTDPEVEAVRTRIVVVNEMLKKALSRESGGRMSNQEAEDIGLALVNPGFWESRERALAKLNEIESIIERNMDYNQGILKPKANPRNPGSLSPEDADLVKKYLQ